MTHQNLENTLRELRLSGLSQTLPVRLQEAVAQESDPLRQFKRLLQIHLELADEFQREARIFFLNADQLDSSRSSRQREIQRAVLAVYVDVITRLRKQGYVKSRYPKIVAFNVLGVINWMLRWYRQDGKLAPAEIRREIIGFVLRGVGVPE